MQGSCSAHGPDLQIIYVTFRISIETCAIVNILHIYKLVSMDVTVTGVTVNHGKIPNSEGYRLSFNYHGNRRGR